MTKEDEFKEILKNDLCREIIEILYEYPCSTSIKIAHRFSKSKKTQKNFIQTGVGVRDFLRSIEKLNCFVTDTFDISYPTNIFPEKWNNEWMGYTSTYEGLNSISLNTNFPDTPETLFRIYSTDWMKNKDVAEKCGVSQPYVSKQNKELVEANIIIRKFQRFALNIRYLKKISNWHEKQSDPIVQGEEETSIFVKELRKTIGEEAKIEAIESEDIKYYNVKAGRNRVKLCTNPMGRYLNWL